MELFGTDGIRGKANSYPLVGDIIYRIGRALVYVLGGYNGKKSKIIIGKDTRLSGYLIESALTSGIISMGADAHLVGPMPTPAIAFLVKSMRADAGVVISASHNPFDDNGIKIFSNIGTKLDDEKEKLIEKYTLSNDLDKKGASGEKLGRAFRIRDTLGRYIVFAKDTLPYSVSLEGLRIVIDCANGATYKVAPIIFEELGAEVIPINNTPNGTNINEKCGSTYPNTIVEASKLYRADVGIAFDGDGDRVIMVDEKGNVLDGDTILAILAEHMKETHTLKGNTIVGTVMSNFGLEEFLKERGMNLVRVDVGDKNIAETMFKHGYNLGGEQSGHIILSDINTTGDGIITSLAVLGIAVQKQKPLSEISNRFHRIPQKTKNIPVKKKPPLSEVEDLHGAINKAKKLMGEKGRIVVRYSGTEPLIRITAESMEVSLINECIDIISKSVVKNLL